MNLWTVTYINKDGVHSFIECDDKEFMSREISGLLVSGVKSEDIRVFPPNTSYEGGKFASIQTTAKKFIVEEIRVSGMSKEDIGVQLKKHSSEGYSCTNVCWGYVNGEDELKVYHYTATKKTLVEE